jgi:hypothetical protein
MCNVYLKNQTGGSLFLTGVNGSSWSGVVLNIEIKDQETTLVGDLQDRTSVGDNWGWLFVSYQSVYQAPTNEPALQLYVLVGYYDGITDYAVQYFDGGKNQDGNTIAQTKAELGPGKDSVTLTVGQVFDPWMNRIDDDLKLHQITIPGTHDSATLGLDIGSECQSSTLLEQLIWGIRYFDIRVDASVGGLRVVHGGVHGSGNTNLYLKDVAQVFCDFLTGKSGFLSTDETIIMQLKADRGSETGMHAQVLDILRGVFANHLDKLYLEPIRSNAGYIPPISALRGKMVLLRRYEYDMPNDPGETNPDAATPVTYFASGTVYNAWSKNPGGTSWNDKFDTDNFIWPSNDDNKSYFHGQLIDYRNRHGLSFVIQDKYEDYGSYQDKAVLVEQYLDAVSSGESPDSWFINFSSCSFPEYSNETINPIMETYFENHSKPTNALSYGTLLMDFVNPSLVRYVIAINFDKP